jgi:hypothetical protein
MNLLYERSAYLLRHPERFAEAGNVLLRPYQEMAIQAVVKSVVECRGLTFVWIFPRQSGKDEALAILVQYLLARFQNAGAEMVFFNPTFKPQTETSMRRLETRLAGNPLTWGRWQRRSGYIYQFNQAFCTYLSAEPSAHVVSATANRLLVVNEAQDVAPLKFDKDISPMAASAAATLLLSGTRWTPTTLLEREYRLALAAQARDGQRRVFLFDAGQVRAVVPEYGRHVDGVVARLGRQNPLVKTQFFCEMVDAQAGMFPPGRQALMLGTHAARTQPEPGQLYAFLIDVAGQAEAGFSLYEAEARDPASPAGRLPGPGRDSSFLKIVEVDSDSLALLGKPTYRVVFRQEWVGASHVTVFGALKALVQTWRPLRILIDATGVGEGLWSLLEASFGSERVQPVKFTAQLKSRLGYGFIGVVESGRYREYHPFDPKLRVQLDKCRSEILPGPGLLMRWGVPDGTRDPVSGELVHDDDLVASALCCLLDALEWTLPLESVIVPGRDPLDGMDGRF